MTASQGSKFWAALDAERPLQVAGAVNAYSAILAAAAGFRAIYLSGSGVATASYGLPDLGITTLDNVAEDVRRITGAVDLPLLVDADTGWGAAFMIARTVRELSRAGAAGIHLEDQVQAKRCGHRPGKQLVPASEMADRIAAAVDARPYADFVVMARTDAVAGEGLEAAIARSEIYLAAGADMIFAEAIESLDDYAHFTSAVGAPILANLTEFGKTPPFTVTELSDAGVAIALYPLSAFRAMNAAALEVYREIRASGTQRGVVDIMQTRDDLYEYIGYHEYESKLDELFASGEENVT